MMDKGECVVAKLSPCALGLAFGIIEALFMLAYAWVAAGTGHGAAMVQSFANMYAGYAPTWVGGVIGGVWGLVIGFIFGALVACLYNCCLCCCKKKSCSSEGSCGK